MTKDGLCLGCDICLGSPRYGPEKGGKEDGTNLVGSVVGITIEDRGVVRGEDKWSFGRGGVFVVGGVTTSKRIRPLLQFMIKMDWGLIQSFGRDGHIARMYPGVHDWERRMFLDDDVQRNDEKIMSPTVTPQRRYPPVRRRDKEVYVMSGEFPESIYHTPYGEKYHLFKDCPTLAGSKVIKERMVCQRCEPPQSSGAQDGPMTYRTARSVPVR